MNGKIVRIISNLYTVDINSVKYDCRARGKFRKDGISPLVGDEVVVDVENNYIIEIKPRKNQLKRPSIANVDNALIITSVKEPELSLNLLDKQLTLINLNNIEPIIILTKLDLLNEQELKSIKIIKEYYQSVGYQVINNTEDKKLLNLIKNKISVLTGQSGVGKSTLLNFLDKDLNLKTQKISKSLGRGVHTTRHVELFEIEKSLIADTPGFSSLNFKDYQKEDIKNTFYEFNNYQCEFKNCMHINELECAIKDAVNNKEILKSRYENYLKIIKETGE